MSKQNVEKFLQKMEEDQALRERLKEAGKKYEGDKKEIYRITQSIILPEAEKMHISFTAEEYISVLREKDNNRELSLDELDGIVGGMGDVDLEGSDAEGDINITDNSTHEYTYNNYYMIFPGCDPEELHKMLGSN